MSTDSKMNTGWADLLAEGRSPSLGLICLGVWMGVWMGAADTLVTATKAAIWGIATILGWWGR